MLILNIGGKGLGKQLLIATLAYLAENNIETLRVEGVDREESRPFYKKTGAEQLTPTEYKYDVKRILNRLYKKSNNIENRNKEQPNKNVDLQDR